MAAERASSAWGPRPPTEPPPHIMDEVKKTDEKNKALIREAIVDMCDRGCDLKELLPNGQVLFRDKQPGPRYKSMPTKKAKLNDVEKDNCKPRVIGAAPDQPRAAATAPPTTANARNCAADDIATTIAEFHAPAADELEAQFIGVDSSGSDGGGGWRYGGHDGGHTYTYDNDWRWGEKKDDSDGGNTNGGGGWRYGGHTYDNDWR